MCLLSIRVTLILDFHGGRFSFGNDIEGYRDIVGNEMFVGWH